MTVTYVHDPPPVPDGPGPSCAYCGRTDPPGGLQDYGVPGNPEHECSDPAGCGQAHETALKFWIDQQYPTVANGGTWDRVERTPWGMIALWRQPAAAKALGFPGLALSAPEPAPEPVVVTPLEAGEDPVGEDFIRREQAAREAVRRVTDALADEMLLSLTAADGPLPETADDPVTVPPSPSPAIDFGAANWSHTIAGNPAHRAYTHGAMQEKALGNRFPEAPKPPAPPKNARRRRRS
jgi:hypothetical protein